MGSSKDSAHSAHDRAAPKPPLIFLCAHPGEARALAAHLPDCRRGSAPWAYIGRDTRILIGGQGRAKVATALAPLSFPGGACCLVFGACGALHDSVKLGSLVQGSPIRDEHAGELFRATLKLPLPAFALVTTDQPVLMVDERRNLAERTGSLIVDMEGSEVARWGHRLEVPWAVVRVVADTPSQPLGFPYPPSTIELIRRGARDLIVLLRQEGSLHDPTAG